MFSEDVGRYVRGFLPEKYVYDAGSADNIRLFHDYFGLDEVAFIASITKYDTNIFKDPSEKDQPMWQMFMTAAAKDDRRTVKSMIDRVPKKVIFAGLVAAIWRGKKAVFTHILNRLDLIGRMTPEMRSVVIIIASHSIQDIAVIYRRCVSFMIRPILVCKEMKITPVNIRLLVKSHCLDNDFFDFERQSKTILWTVSKSDVLIRDCLYMLVHVFKYSSFEDDIIVSIMSRCHGVTVILLDRKIPSISQSVYDRVLEVATWSRERFINMFKKKIIKN